MNKVKVKVNNISIKIETEESLDSAQEFLTHALGNCSNVAKGNDILTFKDSYKKQAELLPAELYTEELDKAEKKNGDIVTKENPNNIPNFNREIPKRERLPEIEDVCEIETSDFMCPGCNQSLAVNINGEFIIRNSLTNKSYMPDFNFEDSNIIEIYDKINQLDMFKKSDEANIISSKSIIGKCPECKNENSLNKWVKHYKKAPSLNLCPLCANAVEQAVTENGIVSKCTNKECHFKESSNEHLEN